MLDHVSIAVSDMQQAQRFYDAVMGALEVARVGVKDDWIGYGQRCTAEHPDGTYLAIQRGPPGPFVQARHWCFKAQSRAHVDAFWQAGIAAGGRDDGPPGLRPHYHPAYYAAFLMDPEGNRIEAVCHKV
jgi:catechol 2,3-dioxygenase-like lactoylglutathione lyase family enzyme